MFLSELTQVAEYINNNAKGSLINAVYRSNGGTLFRLFGARIAGIYFNTSEKVMIPVENSYLFKKEPISRVEEGLRANFTNRIDNISVLEKYGKVVCITSTEKKLIIPLFNGKGIFISDLADNILWSEKKDSELELLKEPMRYFEPVTTPQSWEKKFLENIETRARLEKEKFKAEKIRKLKKLAENLKKQISGYEKDEGKYGVTAPLIKANLSFIDSGRRMNSIEVYNTEGCKETVELDPSLTILENMELFFNRIRKARSGKVMALKRLNQTLSEIEVSEISDDFDIHEEKTPRKKTEQAAHKPFHEFVSKSGRTFLVGKEARDNDELTFKIAMPHDMWFHAKDYQGSHVIMKMKKGETMNGDDLLNGCLLALYYSKAKKGMSGEVWYTERKNVLKKKGLSAGKVIIRNGHVKYINGGVLPETLRKVG